MNKSTQILLGIILLLIGGVIGYSIVPTQTAPAVAPSSSSTSMHRMPDGSMMGGSMQDTMADMNAGLRGKTGDDFDKAFIDEMIVHHQGAIDMANLVLTTSKRPELLELARNIIAAQSKEIEMMKQWRGQWF